MKWVVAFVVAAIIMAGAWVFFAQRSLLYYPEYGNPGSARTYFERGSDVELATDDGLSLQAWQVEPATPNGYAVLYLPGNAGNRAGRVGVAQSLADAGFTVLLVEYPGFGGNPGRPSEDGMVAAARAGQAHLLTTGHAADRIIYVGESVGTGVATHLAELVPPAGLVLRSPFTSLGAAAEVALGGAPIGWMIRDRFATLERMPRVTCPVLVLAGTADTIVPSTQSRAVASAAPHLSEFVELPGVGHNNALWFGSELATYVADFAATLGR